MDRIFKHKKDFLSSGGVNMRMIAAVGKKLERDYLRFFNGLYKLYEKGEKKDELNYIVGKIKRAITTIDNILLSGGVSKKDIEKLLTEINEINESKEVFVAEIKGIKGLKERVEKITEETGVSTEDLNVTEDVVKESIATGSKKPKKPMSETMPRINQVLQEIKPGVKGALFGPFSPLFDVAAGAFKDIRGWMKGRKEKKEERKEAGIINKLTTNAFSGGSSERPFGGIGSSFGGDADFKEIKPAVSATFAVALFDFFDKGAYKARWTKELLSKTGIKGSGDGDLGWKLGAVATAAAFAAYELYNAWKTWEELDKTGKEARESVTKFEVKEEKGRDRTVKAKTDKISKLNISDEEKRRRTQRVWRSEDIDRQRMKEEYEKGLPPIQPSQEQMEWELKHGIPGSSFYDGKPFKPTVKPVVKGNVDKSSLAPRPAVDTDEILRKQNDKLSESIDGLSDSVRKDRELPDMRTTGMKSTYDSADPLINLHSSGRLAMGD